MSIIYLATLRDFVSENQFNEKNYNYLVIKEHNHKIKIPFRNSISVDLLANYEPSDKYLLSFKVEEHQSIGFKEYIGLKHAEFNKGTNNINKELTSFLEFLEADGLYDFKAFPLNEELNNPSAPINFPETLNKEVIASSQNLLDTERGFSPRSRSNSLSEEKTDTESLRRANSLPKLSVENSSIKSLESSTSSQSSLESEPSKLYSDPLVQAEKIYSFFTKNSNLDPFENIKNHGEKIKNGFFNGKEKSELLLSISDLSKKIKNTSLNFGQGITAEGISEFKEDIRTLNSLINDKANLQKLSRYRGFSPLKCFATLWGGGKVTSMEYINQLRNELNPLVNEAFSNRPTV